MANKVMDQLVEDGVEINDNNRDVIFSLAHHIIGGVAGVANHAIGAVGSVTHNLLGDEEKTDYVAKLDAKDTEENKDVIFSLAHHIIGGVTGVANHAIGAVGSVTHNLLGDENDFQA